MRGSGSRAGILVQEILRPDVFWYNAGLPENLPGINFGGPDGKVCIQCILNGKCQRAGEEADDLEP